MVGSGKGLEDLLQGLGALVWEAEGEERRFTFVSRHAEDLLGYAPDRWTSGGSWGDHIHPGDRARVSRELEALGRDARDGALEYRAVAADGGVVWIRDVVSVTRSATGGTTLRGVMLDVTQRVAAEREARFGSRLLDEVDAAVVATDPKGTVTHWNRYADRLFGFPRDEALGRNIAELGVVADVPIIDDGEIVGFVSVTGDITARKEAARAIAESERRFRRLVEQAADSFFVFDSEGRLVDVNQGAVSSLGYTRDELIGMRLREIDAALGQEALDDMCSGSARGRTVTLESVYRRKDGTTFPVEVRFGLLDAGGPDLLFLALVRDISDRKRAEEQIAYLARYDSITGLPNRGLFEEHLELALTRARRGHSSLAVLFVDLDRFHLVNESLGRAAGDELLRQAASRLREVARTMDLVARHGADEFLMLLPDLEPLEEANGDGAAGAAEHTARDMARRVHEAFEEPFVIQGAESFVGATIGISVFPSDGGYPGDLIDHAAAALREARRGGREPWGVFDSETARRGERLGLVTRLRKAIDRGEFVLHYQPLLRLRAALRELECGSGHHLHDLIVGVEALIRWQDPQRGLVPPAEFIPVAEDVGLIQPIADWVVTEACRQSRAWLDNGWALTVGLNLSPRQLWEPELVQRILADAAAAGVDRGRIVIEITESAAMTDWEHTEGVLADLRRHGFGLSIDDFGAGHSSLARLGALPADSLKIDRSFVSGLPGDQTSAMMVTAIVQLARNLGMEAFAEGIETEEQLRFLVDAGCRMGQGFLFSRAVPAEAVASL